MTVDEAKNEGEDHWTEHGVFDCNPVYKFCSHWRKGGIMLSLKYGWRELFSALYPKCSDGSQKTEHVVLQQ